MNRRICLLAAGTLVAAGALVSCSTESETARETGPGSTESASAPDPGLADRPAEPGIGTEAPSTAEAGEITLSELDALMPPSVTTPYVPEPIATSELEDSRVYAHMLFIIGRLDGFLAQNGVPADWETEGFNYISTVWDDSYWDPEVMVGFGGFPDGSYEISGYSGADSTFSDVNSSLRYESARGFVR